MEKVGGSEGSAAGGGRKTRWSSRFNRFFSCVGLGAEAASSFDHAYAPTTAPENQAAAVKLPSSSAFDDSASGLLYVAAAADEPEISASADSCNRVVFCSAAVACERPETEIVTPADGEKDSGGTLVKNMSMSASGESIDMYVAEYVERCRNSMKRRDTSFFNIFARIPKMLMSDSRAGHVPDVATWTELSSETNFTPQPDYNVEEFGNVEITCRNQPFSEESPELTHAAVHRKSKTQEDVVVRVARIFNTFGPRMHMNDGRVVSNFILQALQNLPITIYGEGTQTRSFQYVTDLVDGLVALMNGNFSLPVNIGNPDEHSVAEFAELIKKLVGGYSDIEHRAAMQDDPQRRRPDITRAKKYIGWQPRVPMNFGINRTIEYFRSELQRRKHSERNIWQPEYLDI